MRVWFRSPAANTTGNRARLQSDAGTLAEIVHSPDLRTVSVLWIEPAGELRCRFGGRRNAAWRARPGFDEGDARYVFYEEHGVRVTADIPLGSPMLPALPLRIDIDPRQIPARLSTPGRAPIELERPRTLFHYSLPRDRYGVLRGADQTIVIHGATGREHWFLVGVDEDGTPTATTGYVQLR